MSIYHIADKKAWEAAQKAGAYTADSLTTQGFIHCSEKRQVIPVANTHFFEHHGLLLLEIDPLLTNTEVRYENLDGGEDLYPHIYGPLPVQAVQRALPFEPRSDGCFQLPDELKYD